jgi:putative DNA primase/helicase
MSGDSTPFKEDSGAASRNGPTAPAPRLLPRHLQDLRRSGLSDAQIKASGFFSERDPRRVRELLRRKGSAVRLGPCLVIPFPGVEGYVRLKPDNPRMKDGKPVKYESPVGLPSRLYVPPGTRGRLADPAAELIIVEGEKKAAKADQEGFACVGLVGVYDWQKKQAKGPDGKKGPRVLIGDLAGIPWQGRLVYIVYDSDLAENREVLWAE